MERIRRNRKAEAKTWLVWNVASMRVEQPARQIRRCCSDKKWNSYQKRVACEQLVNLAFLSTESMNRLPKEYPAPFREIAKVLSGFPCLFPDNAAAANRAIIPSPKLFVGHGRCAVEPLRGAELLCGLRSVRPHVFPPTIYAGTFRDEIQNRSSM